MASESEINLEHLDELIKQHMPFIIRTVSKVTGRYVQIEHDDEFSIALSAFAEAVDRFDGERGNFLGYAGLVIRSRLATYHEQEARHGRNQVSLEEMQENGLDVPDTHHGNPALRDEILEYQEELKKFGLSMEDLARNAPKHRDTRTRAVEAAERASRDEEIVAQTYRKKKLPIRPVAALCQVSEKVIRSSKVFILGTMLVFVCRFTGLTGWIQETRWNHG